MILLLRFTGHKILSPLYTKILVDALIEAHEPVRVWVEVRKWRNGRNEA